MPADAFSTVEKAVGWVASEMGNESKKKQESCEICVLELATNATPLGVCSKMICLHKRMLYHFKIW